MKTAFKLLTVIILFSSCSTTKFFMKNYHTKMTEVVINEKETVDILNENMYNDENITLKVGLSTRNPRFISVNVHNKTDEPITIDWYKVSLIDENGVSIKLTNKRDLERSMIPPFSSISEYELLYFTRITLFPYYYTRDVKLLSEWISYYIGKGATLFLPLTFENGKTTYYKARIVIDGVDILQHNPDTEYKNVQSIKDLL